MWRALLSGPEGWERLFRAFEKRFLRPWLRPNRGPRVDADSGDAAGERAPRAPRADHRGALRRALSAVKATARRQLKRARKACWHVVKAASARMPLRLEEARQHAVREGLVALDRKLYRPDTRGIKRTLRVTRREMRRLHNSKHPVIVGPWLSEIGFELLYWIPFLYWARANAQLDPDRLWIVSRGGTHSWYRHIGTHYADVFDYLSPDDFRQRNLSRIEEQGGLKQKQVSDLDREIIDRVERKIPGNYARVLHPSLMYNLFQPYFLKNASVRLVEAFSYYRSIYGAQDHEPVPGLPSEYVAVKFYGNGALPETPRNRQFVGRLLSRLAAEGHVVSLDTGIRFDDHDEFAELSSDRFHRLGDVLDPRQNLDLQTRVIRGASRFYCTYGGFSYLAPLCGTSTVTLFSESTGFKVEHLELARRVFELLDTPPFAVFDLSQLGAIQEDLEVLREVVL